ncbi:MAG: aldehyde dehydrogenase family protein [Enterobacter hormaechei]
MAGQTDPEQSVEDGEMQLLINSAEPKDIVGYVREATEAEVDQVLESAVNNAPIWFATLPQERAAILERARCDGRSDAAPIGILVREAGKTFSNAIAEVREAVDFLHYYAGQVRDDFDNETHRPLGPVVCISPWNFRGNLHRPDCRGPCRRQQRWQTAEQTR